MQSRQKVTDAIMTITNKKLKASITVEAAFSFTLTVFILFMMLGPLLIIKTTSDFLIELNNMSKIRCDYEMIKHRTKDSSIFRKISNYMEDNNISEDSIEKIEDAANQLSFISSFSDRYDEDEREYRNINFVYPINYDIYDTTSNIVTYDYLVSFNLPYNVLNIDGVINRLVNSRRAFVGSDGDRFDSDYEDGDFIYVANNYVNSMVYHIDINCTYLVKKTTAVEYKNVGSHRNYNNQKYSKCDYCFKKIKLKNDTICYITQYGDKFHYRDDCPLMTAYVTKIPKESIENYNLRPCFKCAKEKE